MPGCCLCFVTSEASPRCCWSENKRDVFRLSTESEKTCDAIRISGLTNPGSCSVLPFPRENINLRELRGCDRRAVEITPFLPSPNSVPKRAQGYGTHQGLLNVLFICVLPGCWPRPPTSSLPPPLLCSRKLCVVVVCAMQEAASLALQQ